MFGRAGDLHDPKHECECPWNCGDGQTGQTIDVMTEMAYQLTIHFSSIFKSKTPPVWPHSCPTCCHSNCLDLLTPIFQIITRWSLLPEARKPVASNLRHKTLPSCPYSVPRHFPVLTDHTLIVRSREPVTIFVPSHSTQ